MKISEFCRWLSEQGWTKVENGTKHDTWQAPNGERMSVSRGASKNADRNAMSTAKRIARRPPCQKK